MMKKGLLGSIIIGSMVLGICAPGLAQGQTVQTGMTASAAAQAAAAPLQIPLVLAPVVKNDELLLPAGPVVEKLGGTLQYTPGEKEFAVVAGSKVVEGKLGFYQMTEDKDKFELKAPPQVVRGELMLPAQMLEEAFSVKVSWDAAAKVLTVVPDTDKQDPGVMTVEKAVALALAHSYDLQKNNLTLKQNDYIKDQAYEVSQNTRASEDVLYDQLKQGGSASDTLAGNYELVDNAAKQVLLSLVQLNVQEKVTQKQSEALEQTIAFQVKSAIDQIIEDQNSLQTENLNIENLQRKLNIARLKEDVGMESTFNLTNLQKDLENELKQKELLLKAIDTDYAKLNNLLGYSQSQRYPVADNIEYKVLEDVDLPSHLAFVKANDPYIWMQEQKIDISQTALALYTYTGTDKPYKAREMDVALDKTSVEQLKSKLELVTTNRYNQLRQLEDQYKQAEIKLAKAQDALRIVQVQYNAGMAIDADVKEAELGVSAAQQALTNLAIQHEMLKLLFYKPYLNPEYVMSE